MSTRPFSEMTYFSALAWGRLGQTQRMKRLLRDLLAHARRLGKSRAKMDYFATSLPAMLLFDDDIQFRQETTAKFLEAQALMGLGKKTAARRLLRGGPAARSQSSLWARSVRMKCHPHKHGYGGTLYEHIFFEIDK